MLNKNEQNPGEFLVSRENELREKCGVVGVYSPEGDAVQAAYFAIDALQHRGQDGAGISWLEQNAGGDVALNRMRRLGRVAAGFQDGGLIRHIRDPRHATAHTRYSTTKADNEFAGLQPLLIEANGEKYTLAQNGQFNMDRLSEIAFEYGIEPIGSDTQIFSDIFRASIEEYRHIEPAMQHLLPQLEGSFNLSILGREGIYGVMDRHAVRPLHIGINGDSIMIASEIRALEGKDSNDIPRLDYKLEREANPGTYVVINQEGIREVRWAEPDIKRCLFEKIYLSKADNIIDGQPVSDFRYKAGHMLAGVEPVEADLVIPVLGSAEFYAQGYAEASGIKYEPNALKKNPESDRTFIEATLALQKAALRMKFDTIDELIDGQRLVIVDDSLVRGNTTRQIIGQLRDAGATEVHIRIGSDQYSRPCAFGVNVQTEEELLSHGRNLEEMRSEIGADSLAFLPLDKVHEAAETNGDEVCDGCMGGSYPQTRPTVPGVLLPMAA
jgi:amidophosphoribosyltransferase